MQKFERIFYNRLTWKEVEESNEEICQSKKGQEHHLSSRISCTPKVICFGSIPNPQILSPLNESFYLEQHYPPLEQNPRLLLFPET